MFISTGSTECTIKFSSMSDQFHHTVSPLNLDGYASPFSRTTSLLATINDDVPILSNHDLIVGAFMAVSLALLVSFLQGISSSSTSFRLWPDDKKSSVGDIIPMENIQKDEVVFNEWREMSRPENYIWYANKIRQTSKTTATGIGDATSDDASVSVRMENKIVLFALIMLFVPIFSVEFFFALSRQLICGNYIFLPDDATLLGNHNVRNDLAPWAKELCSPHLER
jgi:hypothetical protein